MANNRVKIVTGLALAAAQWLAPSVLAVGGGVGFVFREGFVQGAAQHPVNADSMDFTYHACDNFVAAGVFDEAGYLWISSFQDVDSVVDSQINDFAANGYHLYAKYTYHGNECGNPQGTCNGLTRHNYAVNEASITLYLDPQQDTTLAIQNCAVVAAGDADDEVLGFANAVAPGQKTETDDLANGDFDLRFVGWMFTARGQQLFRSGGAPLMVQNLVFNGNVTRIVVGQLANDHRIEGSGNLYWID